MTITEKLGLSVYFTSYKEFMQFHERAFEMLGDFFNAIARWFESSMTSLFGSSNARYIKRLQPRVEAINVLEPEMEKLSDADLRAKTDEFKSRLRAGETLDDLLEEAFAVCREASRRVIGLLHYDVQLMGGMVLHSGSIAEMMTGEGKTLVATLPAYLNALEGKGVHVVTVNDYLARRDMEWMGPVYLSLGVTVGAIQSNMPADERQKAYQCDITYGTNNEFGFDYLRDNMKFAAKGDDRYPPQYQQVQGRLHFAIIDEVDNILIDEARTPLIIAGPAHDNVERYRTADEIARKLVKGVHFEVNEKEHSANLNDVGIRHAEKLAGVESFYTAGNMEWHHLIDNALRAHHLYKLDVNYMIDGDEIVIVDEFTGRPMPGRNWSDGLHQAVEAKERVRVKEENQTLATITLQNFFKLYDKIAGMTGTAMTEAAEFWKIYKLDVIAMPTNKPLQRVNNPDVIYKTEKEKYQAIVNEIERLNKWDIIDFGDDRTIFGTIIQEEEDRVEIVPKGASSKKPEWVETKDAQEILRKGRPILVGTVSIEKSELVSRMLDMKGIKHEVLNAKHHQREAEIVAQAGRKSAVTIATNMAGRGTDIILGGNPEAMAWGQLQAKYPTRLDVPRDEWNGLVNEIEQQEQMRAEGEVVRQMGGLHIIGTERHEARRIDLQLRGRCGRQGDPGSSRFFLSLEDDLMRIFAGEWVKKVLTMLGMEDGQDIQSRMVSRRIEGAQKKVEERNFDIRKNLLEYDEVMDYQRKSVYGYRQRILDGSNCKELILEMIDEQISKNLADFLDKDYEAASFAAWAGSQLGIELEARDFRSMSFDSAEDYALDQARRMSQSKVLDVIEENLSEDVLEEEWNWEALTKEVNNRWKAGYSAREVKRIGRENLSEVLVEKANKFIDGVDLSYGKTLLEPDYGLQTALAWLKTKFDITIDFDNAKSLDPDALLEKIRELTLQKYREKEINFPIIGGLAHCSVRDAMGGSRLNREGLIQWAQHRFELPLSLEDFKTKQRNEIEEILFEFSRKASDRAPQMYEDLADNLAELYEQNGWSLEQIRKLAMGEVSKPESGRMVVGSKFAARSAAKKQTKYTGKYATAKSAELKKDEQERLLLRKDDHLEAFCHWANKAFHAGVTPERMLGWDVAEIEDQLCSRIEDYFNPEMRNMERSLVLQILDTSWKDHLLVMDHLRSSVGLRGMGQIDPKVEYKREGMRIFNDMWNSVYSKVTDLIFRMEQLDQSFVASTWNEAQARHDEVQSGQTYNDFMQERTEAADNVSTSDKKQEPVRKRGPDIGRNDPCPCGSGKKYKKCCMKD